MSSHVLRIARKRGDVLTHDLLSMASDLNKKCNQVMHNRPTRNDDEALSVIDGIRFVIQQLYSS